ncbi:MAG: haloacid dehalogenase-like hydrolase, partial [Acidobacteria bacterium]|nr:haloacid dehalogenase-like hydrolase [Acidobacteriota bacterium]
LERHRAAGETTVLTSAGPADLCKPFAETLGFDAVIATEVRDGVIDGHFVWGKGKASAVHHWMIDNGRSLSESTAYSHSVFDLPLLDSVGCPVAVNPDERLAATAADRGWVMIEPVSQSRAMPLDLQQLVVPWIRNEFNPFCVVELDTFAAASEGAFLVEFEVDAAATLVEAVCVIAALSRAMGRGVYVAVPKWLMSTPLLGGLAAVLGAVPDAVEVIDRLLRAGHAVARLAPPGADALSLCVEPIIATFERTATSNEALRPVVRPTFMNSLPAGDAIS